MSKFLVREQNLHRVLSFRKRVRAQFENVFLFSLCSSVSSAWFDYILIRSKKQVIRRTLVREIFNFRLVTFFFRFKRCFTFLIDSFVRMAWGCRQFDRTSFTDHRLTVRRRNISDGPSPFSYFESTNLYFSLSEKRTRQSYELIYISVKRGIF